MYCTVQFLESSLLGKFGKNVTLEVEQNGVMSKHKVRTRTYKEYHSVCPSSELGLPNPFLASECSLPPETGGRWHTSLRVGGWGGVPIPTRGIHCGTLYMYVLCVLT